MVKLKDVFSGHLKRLPRGELDELDLSKSYVCSETLRQRLNECGVGQVADLPVVYPFVEDRRLVKKETFRAKGNRFMWRSRLKASKAPEVALEAIHILKSRGFEVSLELFALGLPTELKAMRRENC